MHIEPVKQVGGEPHNGRTRETEMSCHVRTGRADLRISRGWTTEFPEEPEKS